MILFNRYRIDSNALSELLKIPSEDEPPHDPPSQDFNIQEDDPNNKEQNSSDESVISDKVKKPKKAKKAYFINIKVGKTIREYLVTPMKYGDKVPMDLNDAKKWICDHKGGSKDVKVLQWNISLEMLQNELNEIRNSPDFVLSYSMKLFITRQKCYLLRHRQNGTGNEDEKQKIAAPDSISFKWD